MKIWCLFVAAAMGQTDLLCTETCVNDCIETYYEDYDYDAEQYCYYYVCNC